MTVSHLVILSTNPGRLTLSMDLILREYLKQDPQLTVIIISDEDPVNLEFEFDNIKWIHPKLAVQTAKEGWIPPDGCVVAIACAARRTGNFLQSKFSKKKDLNIVIIRTIGLFKEEEIE